MLPPMLFPSLLWCIFSNNFKLLGSLFLHYCLFSKLIFCNQLCYVVMMARESMPPALPIHIVSWIAFIQPNYARTSLTGCLLFMYFTLWLFCDSCPVCPPSCTDFAWTLLKYLSSFTAPLPSWIFFNWFLGCSSIPRTSVLPAQSKWSCKNT